jgi:uncharacterized protein YecE (DUF72 family)
MAGRRRVRHVLLVIKTGISSWTEKTLVESGWYPRGARDPAARLRYYASRFPLVEADSTYYALPDPRMAEHWVERTPEGFTMNVKAFASLTGHYTEVARLPKDLAAALPVAAQGKKRVYPKDLGAELLTEIARRFRVAVAPLAEHGRLGLVLFQYPQWFVISRENKAQLASVKELFPGWRVAIEFRNATWTSDRNREETLAWLRDHDLVYTCVDEPQGFASSVPPIAEATSDLALVRFHGRSAERWTRKTEAARDRFRYKYEQGELAEWVPKVRRLSERAKEVHLVMNNCFGDYAVVNAEEMERLLR